MPRCRKWENKLNTWLHWQMIFSNYMYACVRVSEGTRIHTVYTHLHIYICLLHLHLSATLSTYFPCRLFLPLEKSCWPSLGLTLSFVCLCLLFVTAVWNSIPFSWHRHCHCHCQHLNSLVPLCLWLIVDNSESCFAGFLIIVFMLRWVFI